MYQMDNNKHMHYSASRQQGFVSILTVIFFMLLVTVITVSFLRIMTQEQRQTLEDSLSKNAYAAAQAGVEDAKRALLYCRANPGAAGCDTLYAQSCPGFMNADLRAALNLSAATPSGIQVGHPSLSQRYTCTTIESDTADVIGELTPGTANSTDFIPLQGTRQYESVRISWAIKESATQPVLPPRSAFNGSPSQDAVARSVNAQWPSNWPAMMRVAVLSHPTTGITYNSAADSGIKLDPFFMYPVDPASAPVGGWSPISTVIPHQNYVHKRYASCNLGNPADAQGNVYVCSMLLTRGATSRFAQAGYQDYLMLEAFYQPTDFKVELLDAGGVVNFSGVRPKIDSTGAASDVFRRVQTTVEFGQGSLVPQALDSGEQLCKNFRVTSDAVVNGFTEDCTI